MKYRVKKLNGKFTIEGLDVQTTVKRHLFGENETTTTEVWKRVDILGCLEMGIVMTGRTPPFKFPQQFEIFSSLEEARNEIKSFKEKPKYHNE